MIEEIARNDSKDAQEAIMVARNQRAGTTRHRLVNDQR
jgi:hypothetical protein